ncbi:flagellar hook-basal body complex protein [Proteinivorax hydrogeniformans]|uniref:Flagellar hook protein FlgE n=1 Tax=Proteinivorax hydrogeniformans TaxID=1826727 RepID=A0AAU8HP47_9FIRM
MLRSMYSGVSGLRNHQVRMDVVGNNIANVNTMAYKTSDVNFKDIYSQTIQGASAPMDTRGGVNPMQVGLGMDIANIAINHEQGASQVTGKTTDLMVDGDGYFMVGTLDDDGNPDEVFYTRAGNFEIDEEGNLVSATNGYYVLGAGIDGDDDGIRQIDDDAFDDNDIENLSPINITEFLPADEERNVMFDIAQDGQVVEIEPDGTINPLGRVGLAYFNNPGGLLRTGDNLFTTSANSGEANFGIPGEGNLGTVMSGAIEMSNVDLSQEFTDMIITQRGFQANSRIITTSDELLNELVNLKR